MKRKNVDVLVVGAGPKGLAVQLELRQRGVDALLVEKHTPGQSWGPTLINPRTPLTPSISHEITDRVGYRFCDFWESRGAREVRDYAFSRGFHTAAHFRHYLAWFAQQVDATRCNSGLSRLLRCGEDFVARFDDQDEVVAKTVVLATGLIGFGAQQFLNDPTGLLGRSPFVQHHPGTMNTIAAMQQFAAGSECVAIIGGGAASSSALFQLQGHSKVPRLVIIADHPLSDGSLIRDGGLDYGHVQSSVRREFLRAIREDTRCRIVDRAQLVGVADMRHRGFVLRLTGVPGNWEERADRIVLATGYRYDYRRIPFLADLVPSLVGWAVDPRYLALDEWHRAATTDRPLPLFVIGEGALSRQECERWLDTTCRTTRRIADAICDVKTQ